MDDKLEDVLEDCIKGNIVLKKYSEQMIKVFKLRYGDDLDKVSEAINLMIQSIEKDFCDPEAKFINDYKTVTTNDGLSLPIAGSITYSQFTEKFYSPSKPIISGLGVMYKNKETSQENNETVEMIETIINMRKKAKKEMFVAMNEANKYYNLGDMDNYYKWKLTEVIKNLEQIIYKLLANSVYGAMGESNSIFYNYNNAASITYTGVQLVTTAVLAFESFLQNNIPFKDYDDLLVFVSNVVNEEYEYEISDVITNHITSEKLSKYLFNLILPSYREEYHLKEIEAIVNQFSQDTRDKVYYKRNLIEFIKNEPVLEIISNIISVPMDNFNNAPEEISEELDGFFELCSEFVAYYFGYADRYDRCVHDERKSVITIDTDSNFISLQQLMNFMYDNFEIEKNEDQDIALINMLIYVLSKFIEKTFWDFCDKINVPDDKKEIINMKSEFLYSRIMLTSNKKHYAGKLQAREGIKIPGGKLDIKGLAIKKVSVNNRVREFFIDIINEDILLPEEIKISIILKKLEGFKNEIRQSLLNGETLFAIPGKVNDIGSYEQPYSQPTVRGTILWNNLYPADTIQTPSSILTLKINVNSLNDLEPLYSGENNPYYDFYEIIKDTIDSINKNAEKISTRKSPIISDKNPLGYGFKTIALPRYLDKIPEWLIQFIDVEQIVNDTIKNGLIIAKSAGIESQIVKSYEHLSNIIQF